MLLKVRRIFCNLIEKSDGWILAIIWNLGMIAGIWLCSSSQTASVQIYSLVPVRISIFLRLLSALLPLLFFFAAYKLHRPGVVLIAAFSKTFLFGFSGCAVYAAYRSAGWLVCGLFLFSELCMLAPTYMLCYTQFVQRSTVRRQELIGFAAISAAVVLLDYFLISPFLANLIRSM